MCDSGVTVIMAASQAVDPGSTPGYRNARVFFLHLFPLRIQLFSFSLTIFHDGMFENNTITMFGSTLEFCKH